MVFRSSGVKGKILIFAKRISPLSRKRARELVFATAFKFGWSAHWSQIKWEDVDRLVFVCTGNICRSAYAEHKARSLGMSATSFGIDAGDGAVAPGDAVAEAGSRGIDLIFHRACKFHKDYLRSGDLVLGMEPAHVQTLHQNHDSIEYQISLLGIWAPRGTLFIDDPYGKPRKDFETCFQNIDLALEEIIKTQENKLGSVFHKSKNLIPK